MDDTPLLLSAEKGDAADAGSVSTEPSRPSLLLIEDNPLVGNMIMGAIEECGCTPTRTYSLAGCRRILEEHRPEAIALDLGLPDCAENEVIQGIADLNYTGFVIIISGLERKKIESALKLGRSLGLNMMEPLAKPFRYEELAQRLAKLRPVSHAPVP